MSAVRGPARGIAELSGSMKENSMLNSLLTTTIALARWHRPFAV